MKINKIQLYKTKIIQEKYNVTSLCAKVLEAICDNEDMIEQLLNQNTNLDIDISLLDGIVHRILLAKENNEKVLICGDYDCDGICATTILYDTLLKLNIDVGYYIPNRLKEGYGLSLNTVKTAFNKGYSLLITVDNGVKAREALQYAKDLGMDIILSDHHAYNEDELIYDYFLHPSVLPEYYSDMCGAGMAYLISYALLGENSIHTILCGIATIGDVVSLRQLNRKIVKKCINLLNSFTYLPIVMLSNDENRWDEKKIAFQIVPKLNCVGRLSDEANVNMVVKYLLLNDKETILKTSDQIHRLNDKRRNMASKMEEKVKQRIGREDLFPVVYSSSFHEGLCGLVASRYVHLLQRPIMVLSLSKDDILKGSIRSESIDLRTFFKGIEHLFLSYGGHKEAAGISFELKHLEEIQNYIRENMPVEKQEMIVDVLSLNKEEINVTEIESLQMLQPFGQGFKLPLFCVEEENLTFTTIGNNKHMKFTGDKISYLKFNEVSNKYENIIKPINFIGDLQVNSFYGRKSIQMIVEYIND